MLITHRSNSSCHLLITSKFNDIDVNTDAEINVAVTGTKQSQFEEDFFR